MRKYLFFTLFLCFLFLINWFAKAQSNISNVKADPQDVETVESIITALYSTISGEQGEERDWNRFRSLFYPEAQLIPSGRSQEDDQFRCKLLTVEEYIDSSGSWLEENGFFETEIHQAKSVFGHLVQVMSTYETRYDKADEAPVARGMNSIQLFNDGLRWWIVNIYWANETTENQIPEVYLN